jgi:DNA modification methylase
MVEVFRCVRDVLADDGTLWLNIGDSYAGSGRGGYAGGKSGLDGTTEGQDISRSSRGSQKAAGFPEKQRRAAAMGKGQHSPPHGLKSKDLIGIPWMLAFALRADGWYLRQEIIWHKPNPMPESVTDRCTKAHESLFLLSKSPHYFCDMAAISESLSESSVERLEQPGWETQKGSDRVPGKSNGAMRAVGGVRSKKYSFARAAKDAVGGHGQTPQHRADREHVEYAGRRNKRSVWTVATTPYAGAHFAVMPEALAEPCILAGSRPDGLVVDPFMGSGTVAAVAQRLGRRWVGAELNADYLPLQRERTKQYGMALI